MNCEELALLKEQIEALAPYARQPTPEERLLPPGHHLEEKCYPGKDHHLLTYVHERWHEGKGDGYVHKSKAVFKGSKAACLASVAGNGQPT